MANRDTIYKELIQLDWEVKDQDEFFDKMTDKLLELGYVKDTFRDAIKTREANYPTALPIEPYPVMLGFLGGHDDPNAGNEHVELLQVLVTNFQKPEVMDRLVNAKTEDEYMEAVLSMEGL